MSTTVEPVKVTPMHQLGADERGSTYELKVRPSEDFVVIRRNAGAMSGNTYHEGKNPGTSPKTFVLLQGTVEFQYRHIDEKQHHTLTLDQACVIEVQPFITHAVHAVTDIVMLECNSLQQILDDRQRLAVV